MNNTRQFEFASTDDSLSDLMYQLGGLWRRHVNARLAELGLSHSQLVFLIGVASLAREGGEVTQRDLCDYHQASRALTSEIVRLLEKNGFIRQVAKPGDARAKSLKLTPSGRERLQLAMELLVQTEDTFLADYGQLKGRLKRDLQEALRYELRSGVNCSPLALEKRYS